MPVKTHAFKETTQPHALVSLLNQTLAGMIALKLAAKQAHWNVRGENFIALHELFDKMAAEADEYADMVAERAVQLHGVAEGTLQIVAGHSWLPAYPAEIRDSSQHIRALSTTISALADHMRRAIATAFDSNDAVTADLLTEISRGLDKRRWMVESHLPA